MEMVGQKQAFQKLGGNSFISPDFLTNTSNVIVVCGWMNGKAPAVLKYAGLYTSLGYRVLVLTSTTRSFLLSSAPYIPTTIGLGGCRFIPHLMSNGGIGSWVGFTKQYERIFGAPVEIEAMILDSCPSLHKPERPAKLTAFYTHYSPFWKTLISYIIRPLEIFINWYGRMFPQRTMFEKNRKLLVEGYKEIPKLFLYSEGDKFVSSKDVEEVIQQCKDQGTMVESFDFGLHSDHVAHMRSHPVKYEELICGFIGKYVYNKHKNQLSSKL
ncbi:hypothetical protein HDV04_000146 [Boothiomyces sp. JEL0838]|nr:hypothetical protein HDV04_000146 [Boothiomyces sp. JEL0838]